MFKVQIGSMSTENCVQVTKKLNQIANNNNNE